MKYAGKKFILYASQPVAIQGSDSLYTYQNTGTGTATIVGSNNAVNWISVTTIVSGDSYTGSHAYAFLMMTGSTEVSVSRGVAGGLDVSSSNPLPVSVSGVKSDGTKQQFRVDANGCIYTRRMLVDTTGAFWFDPDSCSYTLNKNSDGTISTEVYVDPLASKTYTKTYTTTSTQITATGWVAS